jgi:hypothetical protein
MKFRNHKYEWSKPYSATRHQWSLIGPIGGVSFSASIMDKTDFPDPTCGLEFHHSQRAGEIYSISQEAPHHSPCWLLGEPCWHDGTSLYASETVWPMVEVYLRTGDHDQIFKVLEWEYCRHFERQSDD